MNRLLRHAAFVLAVLLSGLAMAPVAVAAPSCNGKFINPITDVCWSCLFPLSVGGLKIWPGNRPDASNPSSPVCACTPHCNWVKNETRSRRIVRIYLLTA